MILQERQQIFAQNVSALIIYIFGKGYKCTLGEAWRSHEQAEIYAKSGKGIVDSLHCKRLAIDLNIFTQNNEYISDGSLLKEFGLFWKGLHKDNNWGGDWVHRPDGNHFEMKES